MYLCWLTLTSKTNGQILLSESKLFKPRMFTICWITVATSFLVWRSRAPQLFGKPLQSSTALWLVCYFSNTFEHRKPTQEWRSILQSKVTFFVQKPMRTSLSLFPDESKATRWIKAAARPIVHLNTTKVQKPLGKLNSIQNLGRNINRKSSNELKQF